MFSPMFDALHFENNGCIERWGIQYVSECSTVTVNPNDSDIILLYKDVARSNVLYVAERLVGLNYIKLKLLSAKMAYTIILFVFKKSNIFRL